MESRAFDIYEAITDILKVFISSEIGTEVEFDNEVIANYINSFSCNMHFWDARSKEEIYEQFTEDIINGYPVWRMLKLSDWTRQMVEASFAVEQEAALEKAKKKYKCLTCKFYEEETSSLGVRRLCHNEDCDVNKGFDMRSFRPERRSKGLLRQLRCRCKLYEKDKGDYHKYD